MSDLQGPKKPPERNSYHLGEGQTVIGQVVEFSCFSDVSTETVAAFLKENVRSIYRPTTGMVSIGHGGFAMYTRYDVAQHKYAGGGSGFIEVLEIKNPPDGRVGCVVHEYNGYVGSVFTEFETVELACAAFGKFWSDPRSTRDGFPTLPGFKRYVSCGSLIPWFYAVGEQLLIGDYAFPEDVQDDPVFRFGKKFVVYDDSIVNEEKLPVIKTCMGTRFIKHKCGYPEYCNTAYRIVYWSDGTCWNESWPHNNISPREILEDEMWVVEAIQQFHKMLAGKSTEFEVAFTNGTKFVGRVVGSKGRIHTVEGTYFVKARVKAKNGDCVTKEGSVDFKPTPEAPDVVTFVTNKFLEFRRTVEHLEVTRQATENSGKKWCGAFFHPPR